MTLLERLKRICRRRYEAPGTGTHTLASSLVLHLTQSGDGATGSLPEFVCAG